MDAVIEAIFLVLCFGMVLWVLNRRLERAEGKALQAQRAWE